MNLEERGCDSLGWIYLFRRDPMVGYCEHDHESSGFIKGGEFPHQLSEY
jgi:hypothetical protein